MGAALLIPPPAFGEDGNKGSEPPRVRVVVGGKPEAMAVEAKDAPLPQVFDAIATKTGTRLHYPALPSQRITATCAGETLKRVMACLLGPGVDLMLRYSANASAGNSPGWPAEAWVLGSSFDGEPSSAAAPGTEPAMAAGAREADGTGRPADTAPVDSARIGPEEVGKLLEMAGGEDPERRAEAIARLAADREADEPTVLNALRDALADEDAGVRAQAVYGLSQRGGAEAPALLKAALRDRDADVRLMAVDSAGTDPAGLELLREALSDRDDTVRALAAMKLEPQTDSDSGS